MEHQETHSFELRHELTPNQKKAENVLGTAARIIAQRRRELGLTGKAGENPLHNNMVWWLERDPRTFVLVDFFNDAVEPYSPLEDEMDELIRGGDPHILKKLRDALAFYMQRKITLH